MGTQTQQYGNQQINVYANLAQLTASTDIFAAGQIVALANPPVLLMCTQQGGGSAPPVGQYATSTTASSVGGNNVVSYWQYLQTDAEQGGSQGAPFQAKLAAIAVGAYTGTGTNTLTVTATGALTAAAFDGTAPVAGDVVFFQPGLTNVAAIDSGPWVVQNPGGTGINPVFVRPYWFTTGSKTTSGLTIKLGSAGAVYALTSWVSTAATGTVIGTTDPAFFCQKITFQVTLGGTATANQVLSANQPTSIANYPLTGGTATASPCPIGIMPSPGAGAAPAQGVQVLCSLALRAGTNTATVGYGILAQPTPGYVGTAAVSLNAYQATMIVNTNADTSKLDVTIINPC